MQPNITKAQNVIAEAIKMVGQHLSLSLTELASQTTEAQPLRCLYAFVSPFLSYL